MQLTFRWFGPADPVPLRHIRQIPALAGVVSALYPAQPFAPWSREEVRGLRETVEAAGLQLKVIESIPIHEDIKLGNAGRGAAIDTFLASLEAVAAEGVETVCYNFMPVFDWTRTELAHPLPDGSTTLIFREAALEGQGGEALSLPGWAEAYTPAELTALRAQYANVGPDKLRENLCYFLQAVVPEAARLGVRLAIHPDDPPWPVLGLPRVVSTREDLRYILDSVPDEHNGLTFCLGSLGARADNDLLDMGQTFAPRIHFVHARNIKRHTGQGNQHDFDEVPHVSRYGSTHLAAVVSLLERLLPPGTPIRPDHGRMIWGETGRAGYGLYDRALGAMYLQGLMDGAELVMDDGSAALS